MKNVIKDKLERFNYLTIASTMDKLAKDYCLNIAVEFADLNSMIPSDKRKNVLIITDDVGHYESRIITLQSKYYPECQLKQNVSIMPYVSIMDLTYEYQDIDFKKLCDIISKNHIQIVYIEGWEMDGKELEKLIKFLELMKIYFINYEEDCADPKCLNESSIIITYLEPNKCLYQYLDYYEEIVSKTVLLEEFVEL